MSYRQLGVGELVTVSDLPGRYEVESINGSIYLMVAADDAVEKFLRKTLDPQLRARRGLRVTAHWRIVHRTVGAVSGGESGDVA